MRKSKEKPYGPFLERLMSEKSKLLSQAQAFAQMGLTETAQPLWRSAASLEERIAPRLDALGRSREAALHRIARPRAIEMPANSPRLRICFRAPRRPA